MNRRQFAEACRTLAVNRGMAKPYRQVFYCDDLLRITASTKGNSITVVESYKSASKAVITTENGRMHFYRTWKKYVEHVSRLTILDQLSQV